MNPRIIVSSLLLLMPASAAGFCGFFVSGADADLINDATQVALMRSGNRTVMSMSNTYKGPPKDFAMVIPVPVVLQETQVKTLQADVFSAVDQLSAPRLVEYWEQDPCMPPLGQLLGGSMLGGLGARGTGRGGGGGNYDGVTVEAEFAVGEYQVVILSAKEANGLEAWLRANQYNIPAGASQALAPYVREGMKFFVAKVDITKVVRDDRGVVVLSPLRFDYQAPTLRLPVRLGLLNAKGKQDLVVYILHPTSRFQAANYENVFIPSNLEVEDEVRDRFGDFYSALFDTTLSRAKGPAVVTEYAWQTTNCDPCPRSPLTMKELMALGADVLVDGEKVHLSRVESSLQATGSLDTGAVRRVIRRWRRSIERCHEKALSRTPKLAGTLEFELRLNPKGRVADAKPVKSTLSDGDVAKCVGRQVRRLQFPKGDGMTLVRVTWRLNLDMVVRRANFSRWVLTRLHTRYDAETLKEDLVFVEASPVTGGRGNQGTNQERPGSVERSSANQFQGRYIIRHYWNHAVKCDTPSWGNWGGPPLVIGPDGKSNLDELNPGAKRLPKVAERKVERGGKPMSLNKVVRSALPQMSIEGKGLPAGVSARRSSRP